MSLICATAFAVTPASVAVADPSPVVSDARSFPGCPLLLEGHRSQCVIRLQNDLNAVNSDYDLPGSDFFGPLTRVAVLDFQGRNGLPADGNVGSETADELARQAESRRGASQQPENSELSQSEQCRALGEKMGEFLIAGKPGQCVPDGVGHTKSASQCAAELAGKEYAKALKKKLKEGMSRPEAEKKAQKESDRVEAEAKKEAPKAEGTKKLSWKTAKALAKRGATVASLYKCMFFDKAEYPSYPLK